MPRQKETMMTKPIFQRPTFSGEGAPPKIMTETRMQPFEKENYTPEDERLEHNHPFKMGDL